MLSAWEDVKAAEAQHAQQEAELFKNKTQTSTFQTEEVRWSIRYGGSHNLPTLAALSVVSSHVEMSEA